MSNLMKPRFLFIGLFITRSLTNNHILKGPDHTNNLVELVTFMAVMEVMFHQVKVLPEDADLQ